jgi:hypothetical protein
VVDIGVPALNPEKVASIIRTMQAEGKKLPMSHTERFQFNMGLLILKRTLGNIEDDQVPKIHALLKELLTYAESGERGPEILQLQKAVDDQVADGTLSRNPDGSIQTPIGPVTIDEDALNQIRRPEVVAILRQFVKALETN